MFRDIDAVIFDLDGTLVDSMWMWRAIDVEFLARYNIEIPEDLQSNIEGMSFSETADYFKDYFKLEQSVDEIKMIWNKMAFEKYAKEVPLKPGVEDLLTKLKEKNIKTGIATSNSRELLDTALHYLNIKDYFDEVHTACEVEKGKPAPDIYLYVAKCLNTEPERCLVFEDVTMGIMAGKNAGMRVCAVQDDYSKKEEAKKRELADYFLDTYEAIDWKGFGLE